jgi:hypothetical protein
MISGKNLFKYIAALLVAGVLFSSCDAGLDGLNDNPNAPTDVPVELILPQAIENSMNRMYSMSGVNGYIGAIWAQSYAKVQYTDEDRYDFSGRITLINNVWQSYYATTLKDLNIIRQKAITDGNVNAQAIAEILMAWNYHQITDLWGDVPFSEALKGLEENPEDRITTPRYDTQQDIYNGLLSMLEDAANRIDHGAGSVGSADLIYGGDMAKWEKLANSLRLRIYLRMSNVAESAASTGIAGIINSGAPLLEGHDDNAELEYLPFPSNNPVNDFARTREDHKVSHTTLSRLNELNDPRMRIYAAPMRNQNPDGGAVTEIFTASNGLNYQGVINGDEDNSIGLAQASTMGHYFLSPTSPGRIMTYNEVLFIRAEAAARGFTGEDAEELYHDAISASMTLYSSERIDPVLSSFPGDVAFNHQGFNADEFPEGISQAEIDDYLAQAEVAWVTGDGWSDANRERLSLQKWLALYSQGLETWSEWRRLGYPELTPGPIAVLDQVPRRIQYPTTEQSLNNTNRQEAVSRQGTDNYVTRIWWDVN